MLGIVFFRKVVLETADSAGSKLEQYQQLQEQVGWTDAQLATCTCPQARATLMYLQQVSAAGRVQCEALRTFFLYPSLYHKSLLHDL